MKKTLLVIIFLAIVFMVGCKDWDDNDTTDGELISETSEPGGKATNEPVEQTTNNPAEKTNTPGKHPQETPAGDGFNDTNAEGTAVGGNLVITITGYKIDGSFLVVKGIMENKHKTQNIQFSPMDAYVLDGTGKKYPLDLIIHMNDFLDGDIASGERREFEYYFNGYKEADSLTFHISTLYIFDLHYNNERISVKFK